MQALCRRQLRRMIGRPCRFLAGPDEFDSTLERGAPGRKPGRIVLAELFDGLQKRLEEVIVVALRQAKLRVPQRQVPELLLCCRLFWAEFEELVYCKVQDTVLPLHVH